MFKKDKAAQKQRQEAITAKTQEEFMAEAKEMFDGADVDWKKYEEAYPEVNMDVVKEDVAKTKGWDSIGFHRVLGGYFYDYGLSLIEMFLGFLLTPILIFIAFPYPEASGYYDIAFRFFGVLFTVFDFATAFSIERFIGEYRVKDPRKMLGFISFYVWWQMITGLVQVTVITVFALYVFPSTNMSYLSYLFLTLMLIQYPGCTGYFKSVLRGLQAFHYDNIVDFLRSNVFDIIMRLAFILLGRWVGMQNPAIGDLMGLAIGAAIGKEVDEYINMGVAIYFFNKVMKPYGIRGRDCFNYRYIDKAVAKTALWWGFQLQLPAILGSVWGFLGLLVQLNYLPQLAYWSAVTGLLGAVTRILTIGSALSMTPAMSEAYMNGKIELARYYLKNAYKWYFTLMFGVLGLLIVLLPEIMTFLLSLPGTENYQMVIPFIVPTILSAVFGPLMGFFDNIIVGTDHPTAKALIDIFFQFTGFTWHLFTYVILAWQVKFGIEGIVMIYTFAGFAHWLAVFLIKWIFIEFNVFHVEFPAWQCFAAPILTTITGVLPVGYAWLYGIYRPLLIPGFTELAGPVAGPLIAAAITLLFALFGFLFLVYLPFLGFWGGWDDYGLLVFRKAYHLTGPSKPLIYLLYKSTELGVRASKRVTKLHNRFPIEAKVPYIQTIELLAERAIHDYTTGFGKAGGLKKAVAATKEPEQAESKPPRFYLTEFFKDVKGFWSRTTRFQKRALLLCAIIYGFIFSPLALFPLGTAFFTPEITWLTWFFYLAGTIALGAASLGHASRYVRKHDVEKTHLQHLKRVATRNL